MPDNGEQSGPYKVSRLAIVNEQIRQIGQRANLLGMRQEIEDACWRWWRSWNPYR